MISKLRLDALLDHPLGIGQYQLIRSVEEKAYEAYVFGLCLRAVRELSVTPVLRGITGPPAPFVFRGAPGQIHSESEKTTVSRSSPSMARILKFMRGLSLRVPAE